MSKLPKIKGIDATQSNEPATQFVELVETEAEIGERGQVFQSKSMESMKGFAVAVYDMQVHAEVTQGGSDFSEKAEKWWGISKSTATKWSKIGEHANKLFTRVNSSPTSFSTAYQLSTLTEEQYQLALEENLIGPNTTKETIETFKKRLKTPKPTSEDSETPSGYKATVNTEVRDERYREIRMYEDRLQEALDAGEAEQAFNLWGSLKAIDSVKAQEWRVKLKEADCFKEPKVKTVVEPPKEGERVYTEGRAFGVTQKMTVEQASELFGILGCTGPAEFVVDLVYSHLMSHLGDGENEHKEQLNKARELLLPVRIVAES